MRGSFTELADGEKNNSEFFFRTESAADAFSDFVLLGETGRMVYGTVSAYGRRWFLKALAPACRDDSALRALQVKEYEILVSLNHPSIIRTIGLREIPQTGLSILTEYIQGVHFDTFAKDAGRKARKKVAAQLLDALAYLHSKGYVHLDLKPENIIITGPEENPLPVLIDFNLSDGEEFTHGKLVGGNRKYAAPEQFSAAYVASPRADIYSAAKLLEELRIGMGWRPTIRKGLSKDPSRRFADASQMKKHRRQTTARLFLASAILVIMMMMVTGWWMSRRVPAEERMKESPVGLSGVAAEAVKTIDSVPPLPSELSEPLPDSPPDKAEKVNVEKEATAGEKGEDFQKYEKGREEMISRLKKLAAEGLVSIRSIAANDSLTVNARLVAMLDLQNVTLEKINREIVDFRTNCPAELLEKKGFEWCTRGDPAILELTREIFQPSDSLYELKNKQD